VSRDIEYNRSEKPTLARRAVAGLVVVAAAILVVHFVVHLVMAVFWIVVAVAAIAAVIWAANELL
jgi:hypothetical protein